MNYNEKDFLIAYRNIEKQMFELADADGDIYVPNIEPKGCANYIFICMEPSFGPWARTMEEARLKIAAGFRNFLFSLEDFILHFCIRNYLCQPGQRYFITDVSKGAMLVEKANIERVERYDRWYPLLEKELELIATPDAKIFAVGNVVAKYLQRKASHKTYKQIIHFSGQAAKARRAGIAGYEQDFQTFTSKVLIGDIIANAEEVLAGAEISTSYRDEILLRLSKSQLTTSRLELLFNYKITFESEKFIR